MKKKDLAITLLVLVLIILGIIYLSIYNSQAEEENWVLYRVPEIQEPTQILWYGDELLFVVGKSVSKLNLENLVIEKYKSIEDNEILAVYGDDLVHIHYKNHIINEPTEYATEIRIINSGDIFHEKYHQTIKPLFIKDNKLFLTDNYVNSPERTYEVDLHTGDIKLGDFAQPKIQGDEYIEIVDGKTIFRIEKINNITSFEVNPSKTKVALLDTQGNVWIYFKR